MRAVAVIPARIASTRLPGKVLRQIDGRPMLAHVYEAVRACRGLSDVIIATDSEVVAALCRQNSWNYQMTSSEHRSGTERVNEVADRVSADVYVNVQADEPLARPEHLDVLLHVMKRDLVAVGTLKTSCSREDLNNPNAVKVVATLDGKALYFSRSPIPFDRDHTGTTRYYKHLGFYAYRRAPLQAFCSWPESDLERSERLEQLRFLEHGVAVFVAETSYDTISVDTEEDLQRVEKMLQNKKRRA